MNKDFLSHVSKTTGISKGTTQTKEYSEIQQKNDVESFLVSNKSKLDGIRVHLNKLLLEGEQKGLSASDVYAQLGLTYTSTIEFELDGQLLVFDVIKYHGRSEIEAKTKLSKENARFLEDLTEDSLSDISPLIIESKGNAQPAFGNLVTDEEGQSCVEILDGLRRREVCIIEDLVYTVLVSRNTIVDKQARKLSEMLQTSKPHSVFEKARAFEMKLLSGNAQSISQLAQQESINQRISTLYINCVRMPEAFWSQFWLVTSMEDKFFGELIDALKPLYSEMKDAQALSKYQPKNLKDRDELLAYHHATKVVCAELWEEVWPTIETKLIAFQGEVSLSKDTVAQCQRRNELLLKSIKVVLRLYEFGKQSQESKEEVSTPEPGATELPKIVPLYQSKTDERRKASAVFSGKSVKNRSLKLSVTKFAQSELDELLETIHSKIAEIDSRETKK